MCINSFEDFVSSDVKNTVYRKNRKNTQLTQQSTEVGRRKRLIDIEKLSNMTIGSVNNSDHSSGVGAIKRRGRQQEDNYNGHGKDQDDRKHPGSKCGSRSLKIPTKIIILLPCVFIVANMTNGIISSIRQEKASDFILTASKGQIETISTFSVGLATKESLGFFNDLPDSAWKRHKERFQLTQPNYDIHHQSILERHSRYSNYFWANNFEPEFTCPHEFRLGKLGDGGKWVCDPHRIVTDTGNGKDVEGNCLVYSVGSNGNFDFEVEALKHVSSDCEIHTFDAKKEGRRKDFALEAEKIAGVTFHHTGLGPATSGASHFKPFREIIKDLGHENRVIDLMKIDCEKCEYEQFKDWLKDWKETNVLVRQVMLEVHNSDYPGVVDLFNDFQKAGYVLFHKEANYINEAQAVEVAWVLLDKDFQQASPVTSDH